MKIKHEKTALVVEGGGMRGIFSAGVLKAFSEKNFDPFDLYIGVSAGACNLASHLAEQYDRNYKVFTDYSCHKEFISLKKFLQGGHFLDLDWLWDITISEYRLDLKKILHNNKKEFLITVTSVDTGKPRYLKPTLETLEDYLKVSSSLPFLYRNFPEINSERLTDGGIADSIPVIEAYKRGAKRIMVLRSRNARYRKKDNSFETRIFSLLFRKDPELKKAIKKRAEVYNRALDFIKTPPRGIEILQIVPPSGMKAGRTTTDKSILEEAYRMGMDEGYAAILRFNTFVK